MSAKKQSEVTRSPFWKEIYTLQESAAVYPTFDTLDEKVSEIFDRLKELLQDTEDKFDRLPDNFKTDAAETKCEERKEALEAVIETIDGIDLEYDGPDDDTARQEWVVEQWQEVVDALGGVDCE